VPGARPLLEFGTFHLLRKQFAANRMTNILVCVEGFLRAVLHAPVSFVRKRLAAVAAAAVCGRDLAAALAAVVYHAIGALVCEISYYVLGMIFSNVPALIAIRAQLLLMTFREEAAYRCACASVCAYAFLDERFEPLVSERRRPRQIFASDVFRSVSDFRGKLVTFRLHSARRVSWRASEPSHDHDSCVKCSRCSR